jgi:MFS family permease
MLMIGIVVFTATSLMCGLAPSTEWLIFSRLLQGFGAAIMIPQGFGLIGNRSLTRTSHPPSPSGPGCVGRRRPGPVIAAC